MSSNPFNRLSKSKIFAGSLLLSVSPLGFTQEESTEGGVITTIVS